MDTIKKITLFSIGFLLINLFVFGESKAAMSDQKLAEMFAPKIIFHPKEKYFPSSVEWYLQRSRLVTEKKKAKKILGIKIKHTKFNTIKSKPKASDLIGKAGHFLKPFEETEKVTQKGLPLAGSVSEAPVYASVFRKKGKPQTAAIIYWTFYPYNGPFQGLSILGKDVVGYHQGDWEAVVVYVQEDRPGKWRATRLFFGRHGDHFGEPLAAKDKAMEWEGTHPVVLAAKYGHGYYPASVSSKWTRKSADVVKKSAKHWNTWKKIVLIDESTPWNQYKGRWGYNGGGPTGPSQKTLWKRIKGGEGAPKSTAPRQTDLLEHNIGNKERSDKFEFKMPSVYSILCFSLKDRDGKLVKDLAFGIKEPKTLKSDKEWYYIKPGGACVKSHVVSHKKMKALVNIKKWHKGLKSRGDFTLVIKGQEPF